MLLNVASVAKQQKKWTILCNKLLKSSHILPTFSLCTLTLCGASGFLRVTLSPFTSAHFLLYLATAVIIKSNWFNVKAHEHPIN